MYALGIDLGTTFTAAATWRNGHAETASLGSRASAIPSVVLLRDDETFLTGEGANRRGLSEPHRVAREFKRRLGDTTPILLGGVPYSAEALTARLLRSVVDEVSQREGGRPVKVCISHPANWGPYKTDLLLQAVRLAGLDEPVTFTTEPEAAAVFYAQQQRIEPGAIVAVYDLGGGTFDAAVLRKAVVGFEILGRPEGIERLGGIDFDAAVFSHVAKALGGKLEELNEDELAVIAAVARLREECVQAKEALSSDTDVSIPILLPNLSTEVRLTRSELESMVRPALHDSIEALKRTLRSATITPDQLHSVLLVGGSSRMPIVAQLVGAELGRPVAVDAHPKHAVALGAAWLASGALAAPPIRAVVGSPVGSAPIAGAAAGVASAVRAAGEVAGVADVPSPVAGSPAPVRPTPPGPVVAPSPLAGLSAAAASQQTAVVPTDQGPAVGTASVGAAPAANRSGSVYGVGGPPAAPGPKLSSGRSRRISIIGAAALILVLVGGGATLTLLNRDNTNDPTGIHNTNNTVPPTSASPAPVVPADEQCTDAIKKNPRWVCLISATMTNGELRVEYEYSNQDTDLNINGGFHIHLYGANADGSDPRDSVMGTQASASKRGNWYIEDKQPSVHRRGSSQYQAIGDSPKICARMANGSHRLVVDNSGNATFKTGNCVPITRS